MSLFKKTIHYHQVKPNTLGILYREHRFEQILEAGYHEITDPENRTELYLLPLAAKLISITNQEVLTRDNIALRFSFNIFYRITDGKQFLSQFALDTDMPYIIAEAEQRLHNRVQISLRNQISSLDSETLNEKRSELGNIESDDIREAAATMGITIERAEIKDISFPKNIQELFAKHLEAKIRAKADIENARTAVATARALKNAAELMKGDENIRFFQLLETLTKIAEKGKHTFMIGDIQQMSKQ